MNSTADKRVDRLIRSLRNLGIHQNASLLVGLSGGGDSMALFSLLHDALARFPLHLGAARISHGIRSEKEEAQESAICRERARSWGIPYMERSIPAGRISSEAAQGGRGTEQVARTRRRNALDEIRQDNGYDFIALGHTADDQIETVLMRFLRGSGPEGLAGIPPRNGPVVRPLLGFTRAELRDYLSHAGVSWTDDPSNTNPRFLRNRIRGELVPLLDEIFPGWPSSIQTLAERSDSVREALETAERTFLPREEVDSRTVWRLGDWETAPFYFKARALWRAYDHADPEAIPDSRFPWSDIVAMVTALAKRESPEKRRLKVSVVDNRVVAEPVGMDTHRTESGRESGNPSHRSASGGEYGWSLLVEREDVVEGKGAVVGGYRVTVDFRSGGDGAALNVPPAGWPLRVEMVDGVGRVEDRTGGERFIGETPGRSTSTGSLPAADDLGEMVYISIVPA